MRWDFVVCVNFGKLRLCVWAAPECGRPRWEVLRCFGKGAMRLNCCLIICLHLTFSETAAVRIYPVYFCNRTLHSLIENNLYILSDSRTNRSVCKSSGKTPDQRLAFHMTQTVVWFRPLPTPLTGVKTGTNCHWLWQSVGTVQLQWMDMTSRTPFPIREPSQNGVVLELQ